MLLYSDPLFLLHDTGEHPENAGRLLAIEARLQAGILMDACDSGEIHPAKTLILQQVHSTEYLDRLEEMANSGGGRMDPDTVVSRHSEKVARAAAGAACDAVQQVCNGNAGRALCLVRPPGHHALPNRAMGFCLLNNIAIAARHARTVCGVRRILIIDWDVHHGNGTQDIFYEDGEITFFSIHRFPFYPGTGAKDETGTGAGRGHTINVPVSFGTTRKTYFDLFEQGLKQAIEKCRPELMLISAGFDAHSLDPIGSLGLESEDFGRLTEIVVAAADAECSGRIVSLLEGGYHPAALAESVEQHLQVLLQER